MKFLKDVQFEMANKGEELVITAKGSKETIANLEKKLGAIQELCCGGECCNGKEDCC